ncbi:MAG: RecQ family ATP-dependent DNA helicase, partial [Actinomycetota bacterium]
WGKSLLFQLAAQLLPGLTLVVSPLISLMKDQAESVAEHGLPVGVINSAQSAAESEAALAGVEQGEIKLLYVTPERFRNPEFMERVRAIGVSLLAVDEAHCVTEWGYDFRPAYLALKGAAKRLGDPTLLALTATANPWVRKDTVERLGMRNPEIVVHGVDRPSLFFEVRSVREEAEDQRVLRALMMERPDGYPEGLAADLARLMSGSGIIYCRTTRAAEETAEWLREWRIPSDFYHGQRTAADRERVQDAFMSGELRGIAATNAFGLGIDKPDVRFVIHRDVPASIEEYFQEAGRAGRDGELARCTLIFRPADLGRAGFMAAGSTISADDLSAIGDALTGAPNTTIAELLDRLELGEGKLRRGLELLAQRDVVATDGNCVELLRPEFNAKRISLEAEENRQAYEKSRIDMMRSYAEIWDCRRRFLLNYFGEEPPSEHCEHCDNDTRLDRSGSKSSDVEPAAPFVAGAQVRHKVWGKGVVLVADPAELTVDFAREGERTLAVEIVQEQGLLEVIAEPSETPDAGRSGESPYQVGDRVEHLEYGPGEVVRVSETALVVLFDQSGYHTLDLHRVREEALLVPRH